ncbi:MAG: hypothetical protein ACPGWR_33850, partial [Ardenticatenaceae bacterium]
ENLLIASVLVADLLITHPNQPLPISLLLPYPIPLKLCLWATARDHPYMPKRGNRNRLPLQ